MTPRIPPVPAQGNRPDVQALIDQATASTGGAQNVFLTMAHHPGLLRRYLPFAGKLLNGGKLPARDRELVILRTAWLCRSDYEWGQHVRIGRDAGLDDDEIARVVHGPDAPGWTPGEAALLRACDELVTRHRVEPSTWAELEGRYDRRQLLELTVLPGSYAMLAAMLNTVGVEREAGVEGLPDEP